MGKENFESHNIKNRESGQMKKYTVIAKMDSGCENTFFVNSDSIKNVISYIEDREYLINFITPKSANVAYCAKIESFRIMEE